MLWITVDSLCSIFFIVPTALKEELRELRKSSHSNSKETGLFSSQPWVNSNDTQLWSMSPSCARRVYSCLAISHKRAVWPLQKR